MNLITKQKIDDLFKDKYGKSSLAYIFSPGRLNIIGEHTDYNDGFVFPAAINKGIYAAFAKSSARPLFNFCRRRR